MFFNKLRFKIFIISMIMFFCCFSGLAMPPAHKWTFINDVFLNVVVNVMILIVTLAVMLIFS